jgi:uncharacterized protein YndB with AHSA1/START domain
MEDKNETTLKLAPQQVILTRIINAPRELVFEAWTEARHIKNWFGPRIFRAEAETDPRKGGKFRIAMIGTDAAPPEYKGPYPMKGIYKEFIKPEKVVYTNDLSEHPQDWQDFLKGQIENYDGQDFLHGETAVTFDDVEGKTKVTITSTFDSDAVRDAYLKTGMNEGWTESLDKLDEMLA